jgi:hypothetical protein
MAHNLTETSTYDTNVTVPDGGDARVAASVETPFQAVANRTKYLKTAVDSLISPALAQLVPIHSGQSYENGGGLTYWSSTVASYRVLVGTPTTDAGLLFLPLKLPRSGTITQIAFRYKGAAGHGALPASMPVMHLEKSQLGASTVVGSATDASGSVGAFEVDHAVTSGVLAVAIDPLFSYSLQLVSEAGANAVAAARVYDVTITVTYP